MTDLRLTTLPLSLAIHALIFAVFLWHGKPVLLPERLITVELDDVEAKQSSARSTGGYERKKQNAKAVTPQDITAKEQKQTAVPLTPEEEPPVPPKEKPVEPEMVGWASPTDNRRAQPALPVEGNGNGNSSPTSQGGPGTGNAASDEGDPRGNARTLYLKEHFAYIRDTIMKNLSYPAAARRMGWEGKVVVSFVVNEDGHVNEIKVIEGSGFRVLDRNAVETVKKASPFPKPPVTAELVMPIVYELR